MSTQTSLNHNGTTPVVVLLGATAVGKTAAISALKEQVGAVIYADASAAYRDLHIGVAKPTIAEQAGLPHYMMDRLAMNEQLNVWDFVQESDQIIAKHAALGQLTVLTGGTLYYLRHFLFGLPQTPAASEQSRAMVQAQLLSLGKEALYAQLQQVDPISASRLAWQDSYRVSRALEVYYDSGKPLSSFVAMGQQLRANYRFLLIQLERPRQELYERINQRVEQMFRDGLAQEVAQLKERGLAAHLAAAKAIGYREFFTEETELELIKDNIKRNTRHYAKRQLTFLRSLPINYCLASDDKAMLQAVVANFLHDNVSG